MQLYTFSLNNLHAGDGAKKCILMGSASCHSAALTHMWGRGL